MSLTLNSSVRLSSGYFMPLLGLGVYQNDNCKPACLAALKNGYRHIDSARAYRNETQVGEAVRESGVPRSEIFITSKIYHPDHGYESTLKAVDESLQRFGFDYIDLYLIHSPLSGKRKRLETWRALLEAKEAGKLRTVGVSNYGIKHLEEIREAGLETPAVNQIEIQPFCQQKPIVEYCKEHGIFVQAYCPLIRGQFDNPVLREVAAKYNKAVPQVLVRWSLQHGFVLTSHDRLGSGLDRGLPCECRYSPLPKSAKPERVVSNADVYDFEISSEDMTRIDALDRGNDGATSWNPVDAD
ncbi:Aldo/keto reductase [Laetiporus sulphureus 93-53]|uniref:Aldo/keto reductase n=1 Tax=Laetiporus sulphureus 93-53 TaxID=1314785 RepID=A0A165CMM3_9APHY|nr:Aldo/keto reductase [Laetiporus sulphureus 93-53]KZT03086.1 Aldo/keto reductase [Laetiporus sulphureus 93-53]